MVKRIPVLAYHFVEPENSKRIYEHEKFYSVTPEEFRNQMIYLKENGYNTITLDDLLRIEEDHMLPEKPVMLTFDDGHISHYDTVLPMLTGYGLKGLFFLVINDIGKEHRITWEQAKVLKDAGMEIGSHSMNHRVLDKSSYFELTSEMKASKIILERELGNKVLAYSIPRGLYSKKMSEVARGMGYRFLFSSFSGNATLISNPYCMKRFAILGNYSMKEFESIVKKDPTFIAKKLIEQAIKNGIQKTIGVERYDSLKKAIFSRA